MGSPPCLEDFMPQPPRRCKRTKYVSKGKKYPYDKDMLVACLLPNGFGNVLVSGYLVKNKWGDTDLKVSEPVSFAQRWPTLRMRHNYQDESSDDDLNNPLPLPTSFVAKYNLRPCFLSSKGAYNIEEKLMGCTREWSKECIWHGRKTSDYRTSCWYASGNNLTVDEPGMRVGRRARLMDWDSKNGLTFVSLKADEEECRRLYQERLEEKANWEREQKRIKKQEMQRSWSKMKEHTDTLTFKKRTYRSVPPPPRGQRKEKIWTRQDTKQMIDNVTDAIVEKSRELEELDDWDDVDHPVVQGMGMNVKLEVVGTKV
jgi:hypothetical protein